VGIDPFKFEAHLDSPVLPSEGVFAAGLRPRLDGEFAQLERGASDIEGHFVILDSGLDDRPALVPGDEWLVSKCTRQHAVASVPEHFEDYTVW
jgi:hypothetical protein